MKRLFLALVSLLILSGAPKVSACDAPAAWSMAEGEVAAMPPYVIAAMDIAEYYDRGVRYGGHIVWHSQPFYCGFILAAGCETSCGPILDVLGPPLRGPNVWNTALLHELGHWIIGASGGSEYDENAAQAFSDRVSPVVQQGVAICEANPRTGTPVPGQPSTSVCRTVTTNNPLYPYAHMMCPFVPALCAVGKYLDTVYCSGYIDTQLPNQYFMDWQCNSTEHN